MAKLNFKIILLVAVILLSGCLKIFKSNDSSGVTGQVILSPTSPVMQSGKEEVVRPYPATICILDSTGNEIKRVETDREGKFRIPLKPGIYTLKPIDPNPHKPPRPESQKVVIKEGEFTEVRVLFDTGIR